MFLIALLDAVAPSHDDAFHGCRNIEAVLPEAKKFFLPNKTNVSPPIKTRVAALLKYFKARSGITSDNQEEEIKNEYKALTDIAKTVHSDMMRELKKKTGNNEHNPSWSNDI